MDGQPDGRPKNIVIPPPVVGGGRKKTKTIISDDFMSIKCISKNVVADSV